MPPSTEANRKRLPKTASGVGARVKLAGRFPCHSRKGMSCAVDTAWHKRGFDSLTGKFDYHIL